MALREINLIPGEVLNQQRLKRHLAFWGACLFMALSLIGVVYTCWFHVAPTGRRPMRTLRKTEKQIAAIIAQVHEAQGELEEVSFVQSLTGGRTYSHVLWKLSTIMNESTWLREFSIAGHAAEAEVVKLNGFSYSSARLGEVLNRLTQDPLFTSVELKYAKEGGAPGNPRKRDRAPKLIEFEIECMAAEK